VELWKLTYNQYCENWLNNSRYKEAYKADSKKWENKKKDLKIEWICILEQRAEEGDIPEKVIRCLIDIIGQETVLRTFRGVKEKGLKSWQQTQTNKLYRETIKEGYHRCEEKLKAIK
jgi:hypothetical protein